MVGLDRQGILVVISRVVSLAARPTGLHEAWMTSENITSKVFLFHTPVLEDLAVVFLCLEKALKTSPSHCYHLTHVTSTTRRGMKKCCRDCGAALNDTI
jgi:hypothetical protein